MLHIANFITKARAIAQDTLQTSSFNNSVIIGGAWATALIALIILRQNAQTDSLSSQKWDFEEISYADMRAREAIAIDKFLRSERQSALLSEDYLPRCLLLEIRQIVLDYDEEKPLPECQCQGDCMIEYLIPSSLNP